MNKQNKKKYLYNLNLFSLAEQITFVNLQGKWSAHLRIKFVERLSVCGGELNVLCKM